MKTILRRLCYAVSWVLVLALCGPLVPAVFAQVDSTELMSPMGRLAAQIRERTPTMDAPVAEHDDDVCYNEPRCRAGLREGFRDGTQSETTIAIDATGRHVVVGFNDFRGFTAPASTPLSVSGYMFSSDGGRTFQDGGQLPVTTGTDIVSGQLFPWVFGDPDVKYLGGCTFVYSSILVKKFGAGALVQTMGVHRSVDCGKTWEGPYEVAAATNPNGLVDVGGNAVDAADKELMDVDPASGRLIMAWANFTPAAPGFVEIRTAISDDGGLTWPASLGRVVARTPTDGQGAVPRFGRTANEVYVSWTRFPSFYTNRTAFARSNDGGLTWQTPIVLQGTFVTQDLVLGNDRSNTNPSMAVDRTSGPNGGAIYVVHSINNSLDGSDVAFYKSVDGGLTFSPRILLNSRPGNDRAQWFPWIAVDETTGRVTVFYYDQGIAASGDLTEVSYLFSNDGGATWEPPRPLTTRPFHAGHGNDTSQPNLGDYVQAVARNGRVWLSYAVAGRPPDGFVDGQPLTQMTVPDATVKVLSSFRHRAKHAPVNLGIPEVLVPGGFADPGETIHLTLPLFNYATNPLYAGSIAYAYAWLSTKTRGVEVEHALGRYGVIAPGATQANTRPFELRLSRRFKPATPIELRLSVITNRGLAVLRHTLFTGTPEATPLVQEDFEAAAPGTLPAGWTATHGGGAQTVRWTTSNNFCGGLSNGAFVANTDDPNPSLNTRWERLFSPAFEVPVDSEYVVVDFDICYDTEEDPNLRVLAYDGAFLRVTDLTPGRTLRSVLAEAFEDEFTTGNFFHYPRHLPRNSNPAYFEDMSAWAGFSNGVQHVRLRLPGMAGSRAQLRFEFTQDAFAYCQDLRPGSPQCGVFVDNVVVSSVVSQPGVEDPDDDLDDRDGDAGNGRDDGDERDDERDEEGEEEELDR